MTRPRHLDDPDHYRDERIHPVSSCPHCGSTEPAPMHGVLGCVPGIVPGTTVADRQGRRGRVVRPVSDLPGFVWVAWDDEPGADHMALPAAWLEVRDA